MMDEVEQRKERSEYKDRIVLLGACSSNTVLNWTAHATVSLCPLSGSTLVEALLCGIPVIAYDVAWHAEILIDDYSGFLVPFRNTAALAEKIIDVVRNHEEAKIAAMRGRELARVAFDKEKIQEKESMLYRQALRDS
jgi:glycosyltransferase involved in cell wall biosynthesis